MSNIEYNSIEPNDLYETDQEFISHDDPYDDDERPDWDFDHGRFDDFGEGDDIDHDDGPDIDY